MQPWPYPFWIAHRGAGKLAPENTLAAFQLGARHGYRAFECDVKLSRDEVPFLLHDADLQRTAGVPGIAGERSWCELSQLDAGRWHSPGYAGEPLPSLQTIAHFCLGGGHALNIEIKPTPGQETRTGEVVALAADKLWQNHSPPPLLSSFKPEALAAAQRSAPSLPRPAAGPPSRRLAGHRAAARLRRRRRPPPFVRPGRNGPPARRRAARAGLHGERPRRGRPAAIAGAGRLDHRRDRSVSRLRLHVFPHRFSM